MLSHIVLVVFLALGLPSSYHAQDVSDVKKSLHQSRSLVPEAATLSQQERAQLEEALKRANVPVDVDELTPEEQKKLAERLGFVLGNFGVNVEFDPTVKLGKKVELGNSWLLQVGSGVTVGGSGGGSASGSGGGGASGSGGGSASGSGGGSAGTNSSLPDYGSYDYGASGSGGASAGGSGSASGGGSVSVDGGGSASGGGSANGSAISSAIGTILRLPIKVGKQLVDTVIVVARNALSPVRLAKNVLSRLGLNNSTFVGPIKILQNLAGWAKNATSGGKGLLSNLLDKVKNATALGAAKGEGLISNVLGTVKYGTQGLTNFTKNLVSNGIGKLINLGENANNKTSGLINRVKSIVKNILNDTSSALAKRPIKRIVVIFANTTKGVVAKALVLVNNLNPIHWIKVLLNRTKQVANNSTSYIQNYWNIVLPKITNNSVVAGILAVKNETNQFLVVTTNAIIGVTNTSANGIANYSTNFVATVQNQTRIAYGKINSAGQLFITTTSNASSNVLNSLYQLVNGTLVPVVSNLTQGGGIAWNQNNTKFYLVDSGSNTVYRFDVASNGSLSNQTLFYSGANNTQYGGTIRDVAVDNNGDVWLLIQPSDGSSVYLLKVDPNTGNVIAIKSTAFSQASGLSVNSNGSITVTGTYGATSDSSGSGSNSSGLSVSISSGGSTYTVDGSVSSSTSGSFSFTP